MGVAIAVAVLAWLAALCAYDLAHTRLPNRLTLPGALVILVGAAFLGRGGPALLGACALAGVYLVVHAVAPAGMGAGDVKLALGTGGLTGAWGVDVWLLAALAAPMVTVAVAIPLRRRSVPHGPGMCLATAVALGLAWAGSG